MSYHTAPASGWELSLVSGFKLEWSGKTHSYRIPLLASLQIILHPLWPLSLPETPDQVRRTELSSEKSVRWQWSKENRNLKWKPISLGNFCFGFVPHPSWRHVGLSITKGSLNFKASASVDCGVQIPPLLVRDRRSEARTDLCWSLSWLMADGVWNFRPLVSWLN